MLLAGIDRMMLAACVVMVAVVGGVMAKPLAAVITFAALYLLSRHLTRKDHKFLSVYLLSVGRNSVYDPGKRG